MTKRIPDAEVLSYLLANAIPEPNSGCLLWLGTIDALGYGHTGIHGRTRRVHRVVRQLMCGDVRPKLVVCHTCDVRSCINPGHLFVGTQDDNVQDAVKKGRWPKGEASWSTANAGRMLRGEQSPRAKLTDDAVREIRALAKDGVSRLKIAKRFGLASSNVTWIVQRKGWAHVS